MTLINNPNYVLLKRRFAFLSDDQLVPLFVKYNGNLRLISLYLLDKYGRDVNGGSAGFGNNGGNGNNGANVNGGGNNGGSGSSVGGGGNNNGGSTGNNGGRISATGANAGGNGFSGNFGNPSTGNHVNPAAPTGANPTIPAATSTNTSNLSANTDYDAFLNYNNPLTFDEFDTLTAGNLLNAGGLLNSVSGLNGGNLPNGGNLLNPGNLLNSGNLLNAVSGLNANLSTGSNTNLSRDSNIPGSRLNSTTGGYSTPGNYFTLNGQTSGQNSGSNFSGNGSGNNYASSNLNSGNGINSNTGYNSNQGFSGNNNVNNSTLRNSPGNFSNSNSPNLNNNQNLNSPNYNFNGSDSNLSLGRNSPSGSIPNTSSRLGANSTLGLNSNVNSMRNSPNMNFLNYNNNRNLNLQRGNNGINNGINQNIINPNGVNQNINYQNYQNLFNQNQNQGQNVNYNQSFNYQNQNYNGSYQNYNQINHNIPDFEIQDNFTPSTKVEVKKKISILDKYKYQQNDNKKRKLVRLSSLNDNNGYQQSQDDYISFTNKVDSPSSEVDELEILEDKIRQNRRLQRAKAERKSKRKHDVFSDESSDNSMSEEEDNAGYSNGVTVNDTRVVEFINNAPQQELCEICGIEPDVADIIINQRPFNTIYEISENDFPLPDEVKPKSKKRKTLGLRIIESTANSLKGYKAVDSLIKTCSEYGDSISKQIAEWGVKITGDGELDLVEIDPVNNEDAVDNLDDEDEDIIVKRKAKGLKYIKHKPELMSDDITLNNYQQVGVNWLNLLYQNRLSCILADEMGLGKTCQVISFMAHLKAHQDKKGPHLVVVPASTIENWMREFSKFCPDIVVQAYYGTMKERESLRVDLRNIKYDVLVTTYSLAAGSSSDTKFLRNQDFDIVVYDEGHFLKNSQTDRYAKLMRMNARFRLLLTGTPLQNNLKELVSLLSFILPKLFNEKREDLEVLFNQKSGSVRASATVKKHNPLLAQQAIDRARTMMTPFVLRRKKSQVLQHLPAKCHEIIDCTLNDTQKKIYDDEVLKAKATRAERERRKLITDKKELEELRKHPIPNSTNVLMALRKASIHPLLFRVIYNDLKLKKMAKEIREEPEYVEANEKFIYEDMQVMSDFDLNLLCEKFPKTLRKYQLKDDDFLASGKITEFTKLLKNIIEVRKEKVLVFSLFTQVLDILEKVLSISGYKFLRLDGSTSVETRQDIIDSFYEDDQIPIFLLSTKAGGFGINLVAANNVIIFDQSFNPHDDKQAEDRAHRVGQKKEVTVYKLIVKDNIEENILHLAENKLQLDQSISADDAGNDGKFEERTASLFERLLL